MFRINLFRITPNRINLYGTTLAMLSVLLFVSSASGQVAISASIQGMFDDNVFLESGVRRPVPELPAEAIEQGLTEEDLGLITGEPADGLEDEDFITTVSLNASSSLDRYFGDVLKGGWELGAGFIIFSDFSDNNRVTIDSSIQFGLSDNVIPEPFFMNFSSGISSQTVDLSVASNSAARSTQVWNTNLRTGIQNYQIASNTNLGAGYDFSYSNFLGEFLLEGDRGNGFDQNGSDFYSHRFFIDADNQVTKSYNTGISATVNATFFSDVGNNDLELDKDEDDLDRLVYEVSWVNTYIVSNKLSFSGSVGANITSLSEDQEPTTTITLNEQGQEVENIFQRDDTQSGIIYELGMAYNYAPGSSFNLRAVQNRTPDIDGDLLTTRSYRADLTKSVSDRLSLNLGANYFTFSAGDTLSNGIDRLEADASINYAITQDTTLTLGYFFSDQESDDANLDSDLLFQTQDFRSNRFFIGISSGLIGQNS